MLALTLANLKPTETVQFTVLALIHNSMVKVYPFSVCVLFGQYKGQWGPACLRLICTGVAALSSICNDEEIPVCWLDNELVNEHIT